jgi:hypothetical protein
MRRTTAAAVCAALLGACSSVPEPVEEAQAAFEKWVAVQRAGDAAACWEAMSPSYRSQWLFERALESSPAFQQWRGGLTGVPRTELDIWIDFCRRNYGRIQRAEVLPGSVYGHPSLLEYWKSTYSESADLVKAYFSRLEILSVSGDALGVSVMVKGQSGRPELYGMVDLSGGWKIDQYRPASANPPGR